MLKINQRNCKYTKRIWPIYALISVKITKICDIIIYIGGSLSVTDTKRG